MSKFDNMKLKSLLLFLLAFSSVITVISCYEDDNDETTEIPPLDRGQTEVDKFIITYLNLSDYTTAEYTYYDQDGVGGNPPSINDTIFFDRPLSSGIASSIRYKAEIKLFLNEVDVTDKVITNYDNYIFCYTDYDTNELVLESRNDDPNGKELGNLTDWRSLRKAGENPSGEGVIKITLNYQKGAKENLCNPGIRIIEAIKPYKIQ